MSVTAISIVQAVQLPAAAATQYTVPALQKTIVRHAVFANTTAGAITITAHMVPSGGTLSGATQVIPGVSVAANTAYTSPEFSGLVMNSGDTIQAFASSAGAISVNISGIAQS